MSFITFLNFPCFFISIMSLYSIVTINLRIRAVYEQDRCRGNAHKKGLNNAAQKKGLEQYGDRWWLCTKSLTEALKFRAPEGRDVYRNRSHIHSELRQERNGYAAPTGLRNIPARLGYRHFVPTGLFLCNATGG